MSTEKQRGVSGKESFWEGGSFSPESFSLMFSH
jgi:hypothetical protein